MTDKIDAHHHLWRYTPEEYGWIGDEMAMLRPLNASMGLMLESISPRLRRSGGVPARRLKKESWN